MIPGLPPLTALTVKTTAYKMPCLSSPWSGPHITGLTVCCFRISPSTILLRFPALPFFLHPFLLSHCIQHDTILALTMCLLSHLWIQYICCLQPGHRTFLAILPCGLQCGLLLEGLFSFHFPYFFTLFLLALTYSVLVLSIEPIV